MGERRWRDRQWSDAFDFSPFFPPLSRFAHAPLCSLSFLDLPLNDALRRLSYGCAWNGAFLQRGNRRSSPFFWGKGSAWARDALKECPPLLASFIHQEKSPLHP